jgi:hypothetical protein
MIQVASTTFARGFAGTWAADLNFVCQRFVNFIGRLRGKSAILNSLHRRSVRRKLTVVPKTPPFTPMYVAAN